jgi:hypothetical protein
MYEDVDVEEDTYNHFLATLHLNKSRTVQMIRNARYVVDKIDPADYDWFDSSVLDLMRRNKKDPMEYLDDIKAGLSYSDIKDMLCEEVKKK